MYVSGRMIAKATGPKKKVQAHSAFFADPKDAGSKTANPRVNITEAFDDDRLPRVWTDEGTRRTQTELSVRAAELEATFQNAGFNEMYGMKPNNNQLTMTSCGLSKLASGGFNQLWTGTMTNAARRALPQEIAELMKDGKLVIRAPLASTHGSTRNVVLGEISNVLHAALYGYAPLVAGIAWIRTLSQCETEEGLLNVRFRLVMFLERAEKSVYSRIKEIADAGGTLPLKHVFSSAISTNRYFDALLRCVFAFSSDRFVYLDATLRNFVDFASGHSYAIKLIDIDQSVFRRLSTVGAKVPSRAWQLLWLHNTLVVSCFLKRQLAGLSGLCGLGSAVARALTGNAGDGDVVFETHWMAKIRPAMQESRALLVSSGSESDDVDLQLARDFLFASAWPKGSTLENCWSFPDLAQPPYCGEEPEAIARSALAFVHFYFLRQQLEEIEAVFVKPAIEALRLRALPNASARERETADAAHRRGARWYDAIAKRQHVPCILYFHEKISDARKRGGVLLVDILSEFVNTPHSTLEVRYAAHARLAASYSTRAELENLAANLLSKF